jgi:hypothetical protein
LALYLFDPCSHFARRPVPVITARLLQHRGRSGFGIRGCAGAVR